MSDLSPPRRLRDHVRRRRGAVSGARSAEIIVMLGKRSHISVTTLRRDTQAIGLSTGDSSTGFPGVRFLFR